MWGAQKVLLHPYRGMSTVSPNVALFLPEAAPTVATTQIVARIAKKRMVLESCASGMQCDVDQVLACRGGVRSEIMGALKSLLKVGF